MHKKTQGRKKCFKNILTSLSSLAFITGLASNASATLFYDELPLGGSVVIKTGQTPTNATDGDADPAWSDNDSFYFDNNDVSLSISGAKVATIDMNGAIINIGGAPVSISVLADSSIGSLVDSDGGSNGADLTVSSGVDLTLYDQDGKDAANEDQGSGSYSSLESITLGNESGGSAASLEINVATNVPATINTYNGATAGNITANVVTTFSGALGQEAGGGLGIIYANQNVNFTSDVTAKNLYIASEKTVNVKGDFTGDIDGAESGVGKLKINDNDVTIEGDIGSLYPLDKIDIPSGKKRSNFNGSVSATTVSTYENTNFNNGLTVESLSINNPRTVTVQGTFDIAEAIDNAGGSDTLSIAGGAVGTIASVGIEDYGLSKFSVSDSSVNITKAVYARDVEFTRSNVEINTDITIDGAAIGDDTDVVIEDSTLNVGSSNLTSKGPVAMSGACSVQSQISGKVGSVTGGKVIVIGDLDFDPDATLLLSLDDKNLVNSTNPHEFTLITSTGGTPISAGNITIIGANKTRKWTPVSNATSISITSSDNVGSYLSGIIKNQGANINRFNAAAKLNAVNTRIVNLIGELSEEENEGKIKEILNRIIHASAGAAEAASGSLTGAQNLLSTRIESFLPSMQMVSADENITGVAAGDDGFKYGAWVNPFYGMTYQDEKNNVAGYKSVSYGAAFGFDGKVNENAIIGVSITAASSYTRHKDFKSGDKTRFKSFLMSVYNMFNLSDDWFTFGYASLGKTRVSNEAKRASSATDYEMADGKYSVTSFGLKEMLGYNFSVKGARITPMVGLKYSRVNNIKYQEYGTSFQNLNVSSKSLDRLEAIMGASIAGASCGYRGAFFTPQIHSFINYELLNKSQKSSVVLGAAGLESRSKGARLSYDLGLGLRSEYNAFEYEAGYDAQLSDKRSSYQGSFKVRVNF